MFCEFFCGYALMHTEIMHACDYVCGDEGLQSLSLSFCSIHPAAALRFHHIVTLGSENVGFNWTLFRPFRVQLVESDPSVGCSLSTR